MTRIAIEFFGHLRTFEKCFPYLKKYLLNNYKFDIFMHTWDVYNHNTKTHHTNFVGANKKVNVIKIKKHLNISDEQIIVQHQPMFDQGNIITSGFKYSLQGLSSIYYSIKTVNKLREDYQKKHNIKYDCVIIMRPDIVLIKKLDLNKYINKTNYNTTIYFCGDPSHDINNINGISACDLLLFGSSEVVSSFCKELKPLVKNGDVIDCYPESLMIKIMQNIGINTCFVGSYLYRDAFAINRNIKIERSNIISFHVKKNCMQLYLFRIFHQIFRININVFGFNLDLSIGKSWGE